MIHGVLFLLVATSPDFSEAKRSYFAIAGPSFTWLEASNACSARGAALAIVESATENNASKAIVDPLNLCCYLWLGLSYDSALANWRWQNSHAVNFINWASMTAPAKANGSCILTDASGWISVNCLSNMTGSFNNSALCMTDNETNSSTTTAHATFPTTTPIRSTTTTRPTTRISSSTAVTTTAITTMMAVTTTQRPSTTIVNSYYYEANVKASLGIVCNVTLAGGYRFDSEATDLPAYLYDTKSPGFAAACDLYKPPITQLYQLNGSQVISVTCSGFRKGSIITDYIVALRSLTQLSESQIRIVAEEKFGYLLAHNSSSIRLTKSEVQSVTVLYQGQEIKPSPSTSQPAGGKVDQAIQVLIACVHLIYIGSLAFE